MKIQTPCFFKKIEDNYDEYKKYRKVRGHCYYTGEYKGAA